MKKSAVVKASRKSAVTQPKNEVSVKDHVAVDIFLPPDLRAWAEEYAYNLSNTLSDVIRDLLEWEKYRDQKPHYTTCPKGIREFEADEKEFASKRKAGAR